MILKVLLRARCFCFTTNFQTLTHICDVTKTVMQKNTALINMEVRRHACGMQLIVCLLVWFAW